MATFVKHNTFYWTIQLTTLVPIMFPLLSAITPSVNLLNECEISCDQNVTNLSKSWNDTVSINNI